VAGVLVSNGVPGSRITATGRGEDAPVASNLTPEGRTLNRRVEVIIKPTTQS
jgi:outer membrane protein OmpA-like peptidoglycan-associated protein